MKYSQERSLDILQRTPVILRDWLSGLDEEWLYANEGPETFSPFDVVGHLIHGERTDWTARARIILEKGNTRPFDPYDRFAQQRESKGKSMDELLVEFESLRKENINSILSLQLKEEDLDRRGMHPSLGEVSLRNLLSTWVVHDLTHLAQIGRVMAKQYKEEMGPWPQYFRILSF